MAYTAIDDPEAYFQTVLYTGDGNNSRTITLPGDTDMQPDMIWLKERSSTSSHYLTSIGMGIGTRVEPDGTSAESTEGLSAVTSDGFTIGTSTNQVNQDTITHVAWCWKESATAGMDIVTWTGNGSSQNISHSLSAVPHFMITKNRSATGDWTTYHKFGGGTKTFYLSNTDAIGTTSSPWNDTTPTSSVFTVGAGAYTNGDGNNIIGYLWTEKQGYSKFGSYTGNGNADGAFIYTGFRPAFVLAKNTGSGHNWWCADNKRDTFNVMGKLLRLDVANAETSGTIIDFLSNGFKLRESGADRNEDDAKIIYMAFAEAPFVNSKGVPNNAR